MLKSMRIGVKLYLGFGIILALLVILGVASSTQLFSVETIFNHYRGVASDAHNVGELQSGFLLARVDVKNFMNDGNPANVDEATSHFQAARDAVEATRRTTKDPHSIALLDEMDRLINTYKSSFMDFAALEKQRIELETGLATVGPEIQATLSQIMTGSERSNNVQATYRAGMMLQHLLLARLHASKFLAGRNPSDASRSLEEIGSFTQAMPDLQASLAGSTDSALSEQARVAGTKVETYSDGFQKIISTVEARDKIMRDVLDVVGPEIVAKITAFNNTAKRERDTLGPQAVALITQTIYITIGLSVIAVVVGILAAWIIGAGIAKPIRAMTEAMRRLADKDYAVEIPAQDHKDEVGDMSKTVQIFKENGIRIDRMQAEQESEHRRNARRVKTEMFALTNALDQQVRGSISEVQRQANVMHDAAVKMTEAVTQTEQGAGAAAGASRESSSSVDAVAAAAEEMASSIAEISRQVNGASEITRRASRDAESTNDRIQNLAQAANQIGEVVNLISDIAKQTNLLALNATIEAARAGEAGKGFAVVANEVKTLANQTAHATEDIANQIGTIQTSTREAVAAIQGIVSVIGEINEITTGVSAAVEEQTAATREISQNAQQAAQSTQDASSNIENVSHITETTGGHARDVREAAEEVRSRIQHMLDDLERIVRSGSEEERQTHGLRTVNVAVTVDLGRGQKQSCLLQDMSFSGVAVLDRPLEAADHQSITLEAPDLGRITAMVVACTEHNTHLRMDVADIDLRKLEDFVRRHQRKTRDS